MSDTETEASNSLPKHPDALPKQPDALAIHLILKQQPELFCDIVGQRCIRLPSAGDEPAEETWILRSERVRAWIAFLIWDETKSTVVLQDREIDRVINVLEGMAWLDQRWDVELFEAIESDGSS